MKSTLEIISMVQARVDAFLKEIFDLCESSEDSPKTRSLSETVAAEIAICEAVEVAIRRQRNACTLFSHLPAEIVHSVFGIALNVDGIHDPNSFDYEHKENEQQLEDLRIVSSAWNDFLLLSPRYWQVIDVRRPHKDIATVLERSGSAPLHIHCLTGRSPESPLNLIPAARIQTLRSSDPDTYLFLRRFLQNPMPALRTLELASSFGMLEDGPSEPLGDLPSLRHLHARGWQPPGDAAFLPNLKELFLYRQRDPQIMKVLLVLSACINLEQLAIECVHGADQGDLPGTIAPITLPHLRAISLVFQSSRSAVQLIRKLILPQCLRRSIHVVETVDFGLHIADYRRFMCMEESRLGRQPESAAVLLNGVFSWNRIEYRTESLEVKFKLQGRPAAPAFHDLVQEFQTGFGGPPLTVTIEGPSELPMPLFESLGEQNVQAIVIHCNYAPSWNGDIPKIIKACLADRPGLDEPTANAATNRSFKSLRSIEFHDSLVKLVVFIRLVEEYLDKASRPLLEEIILLRCELKGMSPDQAVERLERIGIALRLVGSHEDEDDDDDDDDDED
ncbi:hypothetical protein FRC01_006725 [Tulasnella sp. 417]|nr:hypothetical protein FRC01_006725 [Tulasnella sp. 417]